MVDAKSPGITLLAALVLAISAHGAAVVSVSHSSYNLTSVTVARGTSNYSYTAAQLIGFDITAYNSGATGSVIVADGAAAPATNARAALVDGDWRLDTGIVNLDYNPASGGDPAGLRIVFNTPIVNSAGADVILFDIAPGTPAPDGFAVKVTGSGTEFSYAAGAAGGWSSSLVSSMPFDIFKTRNSGNTADAVANTLNNVETLPLAVSNNAISQNVYGIGIDLSDLGVAPGASVSSLDFRSIDSTNMVDPMLIAGLPAVPEPAAATALVLCSASLLRRGRRA